MLEPLIAYLTIAARQSYDRNLADCYNVGPDECDCLTTGELASLFCRFWGCGTHWIDKSDDGPHEANFLKLDCSKIKSRLEWYPRWHIEEAVQKTIEWTRVYQSHGDIPACMTKQIECFMNNGED